MAVPDVKGFVYRVIDIFPGPLKTAARWVADRIFGVWDEIFQLLVIFRPVWLFFQGHIQGFISAVFWLAEETGRTLRWLVTVAIPRWANWALDTGVHFMLDQVGALRRWAQGTFDWLRELLSRAINAVSAFAHNVLTWTVERIREVWATLSVIRDRVVALLSYPEAFVDWVFSALWRRFWRFANDHAEAIAGAIWARRDPIIAATLARLEAFLVRLL